MTYIGNVVFIATTASVISISFSRKHRRYRYAQRQVRELKIVGMFVKTYPVISDISDDTAVGDYIVFLMLPEAPGETNKTHHPKNIRRDPCRMFLLFAALFFNLLLTYKKYHDILYT